jgi:Fe-S cluster biogenesis protein NfuA
VDTVDTKSSQPGEDALRAQFQGALEKLRPGFQADGMDLKVGAIGPRGTVEVKVLMGPNACEECLLPPATLAQFFLVAIRGVSSSVTRVDVTLERAVLDNADKG